MTRHEIIASTITAWEPGIKDLAARMQCSANLLYRAATPGESGCDLSLGKIQSLMQITRDTSVLHWLNAQFNFCAVAIPSHQQHTPIQSRDVIHLHRQFIATADALHACLDAPETANKLIATLHLSKLIGTAASLHDALHPDRSAHHSAGRRDPIEPQGRRDSIEPDSIEPDSIVQRGQL